MAVAHLFPLATDVFLSLLSLALLLLCRDCQLFELVPAHLHVGANDAVGNGGNCGVPVLVLTAVEKTLHHDWVGLSHVSFDQLLN